MCVGAAELVLSLVPESKNKKRPRKSSAVLLSSQLSLTTSGGRGRIQPGATGHPLSRTYAADESINGRNSRPRLHVVTKC